jgi:transcription elongation factor Elf1
MEVFIIFLVNIGLISAVSAICGLVFYFLTLPFWSGFGICFILFWILGWAWTTFVNKISKIKYEEVLRLKNIEQLRGNVEFSCAYCNIKNVAPIRLNQENTFICSNCGNKNKVDISYAVMRTTEPVSADSVLKQIFEKIENQEG